MSGHSNYVHSFHTFGHTSVLGQVSLRDLGSWGAGDLGICRLRYCADANTFAVPGGRWVQLSDGQMVQLHRDERWGEPGQGQVGTQPEIWDASLFDELELLSPEHYELEKKGRENALSALEMWSVSLSLRSSRPHHPNPYSRRCRSTNPQEEKQLSLTRNSSAHVPHIDRFRQSTSHHPISPSKCSPLGSNRNPRRSARNGTLSPDTNAWRLVTTFQVSRNLNIRLLHRRGRCTATLDCVHYSPHIRSRC